MSVANFLQPIFTFGNGYLAQIKLRSSNAKNDKNAELLITHHSKLI